MPRKEPFDVTVSKEGYSSITQHVRSAVAGGGTAGMAGNVIAGGVIGMVVDGSNGSMNDLIPNPLTVTLTPNAPAGSAPDANTPRS